MTLSDKSCTSPTLRCCAATAPPTTSPHARRPASAGFCGLSVIHTSFAAGPAPTASPAPRPRNIPARPSPRRRKTKTKGRVSRPGPSSCSFCWALPPRGVPLGALQVPLVVGEHRVEKVHVGVHGLLRERLRGLTLPLLKNDCVISALSCCAETLRSATVLYESRNAAANFSAASLTCCCCFASIIIRLPPAVFPDLSRYPQDG